MEKRNQVNIQHILYCKNQGGCKEGKVGMARQQKVAEYIKTYMENGEEVNKEESLKKSSSYKDLESSGW